MVDLADQWFDLVRLGFPGWEHTQAYLATTDTAGRGLGSKYLSVRMKGSSFEARLFDTGGGMFKAVARHIEAVNALVAKQDRPAS